MSSCYVPPDKANHENSIDDDSDSLWDELSHQQTREIQQHQDKIHNDHLNTTTANLNLNPFKININIETANAKIRQAANKFAAATKTAADYYSNTNTNTNSQNHGSDRYRNRNSNRNGNSYRNINVNGNHANESKIGTIDESHEYTGPYAKASSKHTGRRHNNDLNGACDDFGLRDSYTDTDLNMNMNMNTNTNMNTYASASIFGEYDPFRSFHNHNHRHHPNSNHDTQNSATSAPLLSNNYGMDVELGNGHAHARANEHGSASTSASASASSPTQHNTNRNHNHNQHDKKYVFLQTFRVKKERGTVANLDLFFTSLYNYYYHRGVVPIIGKGIVELISLFFTLWLSVFLIAYVDWQRLRSCKDEETCEDFLSGYIYDKPLRTASFKSFIMILYIVVFSAYGVFAITTFVSNVKDALYAKFIFEDKLGISVRKLEGGAIEWHEIVAKILALQRSGEYKIAIHDQDVKDELVITQRILRRENFMIAFFNQGVLDLTVQLPWKKGEESRKKYYSKSIEWSIYFCILSYMFNHKYQIRPAFCMDAIALQRRFVFCGIAHAIFMPFLLFFMTLHFFIQNLYNFQTAEQYLGPREWSNVAKWTFREFNELPHVFEQRLAPSYEAADAYLKLFAPSAFVSSVGRLVVFLSGSLGAVCLALAAINDSILLHVKVGNWNLLWYAGMIGVAYSAGKSMLPDETVIPRYHHNLFADIDAALVNVSNHTHYYPEFWKKRGWDDIVKAAFSQMFRNKVLLFFHEVLSTMVAPVVLCYSLPSRAVDICAFVQKIKSEVTSTGDHCGFATFDFDLFNDENWEGQQNIGEIQKKPTTSSALEGNRSVLYHKLKTSRQPQAKMGKMEKSFFNFKTIHPHWKCTSSGQDLVNRIENYRNNQEIALSQERQHHIAAAARQLEALLQAEDKGKELNPSGGQINEQYVTVEATNPDLHGAQIEHNELKRETNDLRVQFKEPAQYTSHLPSSRDTSKSNLSVLASALQYDDIGLSAELNGLLERSTLDTGTSLLEADGIDQSLPSLSFFERAQTSNYGDATIKKEQALQRQYKLLEKYHSQMQESPQNEVMEVPFSSNLNARESL